MDNKELVAGTTLYIPVFVPGALFEVGDGHAAQGDGEVDQTAIETSLRGRLQLTVRKDMKLTWPRAETATDYISMGADPDLKVATTIAIQEMVDFLAATQEADEASGLSARQHRRQRRDHAARRPACGWRPREDAEKYLQIEPARRKSSARAVRRPELPNRKQASAFGSCPRTAHSGARRKALSRLTPPRPSGRPFAATRALSIQVDVMPRISSRRKGKPNRHV